MRGWMRAEILHMVHVLKCHLDNFGMFDFLSKHNILKNAPRSFEGIQVHMDAYGCMRMRDGSTRIHMDAYRCTIPPLIATGHIYTYIYIETYIHICK